MGGRKRKNTDKLIRFMMMFNKRQIIEATLRTISVPDRTDILIAELYREESRRLQDGMEEKIKQMKGVKDLSKWWELSKELDQLYRRFDRLCDCFCEIY